MSSILTVVTPAASQDLVTLAAMKAELGITDSASDTRLGTLIAQASAICAGYCQRVFIAETVSEVFEEGHWCGWARREDRGFGRLKLRRYPIQSVTSVVENAVALVVTTDYLIDSVPGELVRQRTGGRYSWASKQTTVVYVGGYPANAVPPDLARACMDIIMQMGTPVGAEALGGQYNRIGVPGVIDLGFGGASASATEGAAAIPASALELLARYQDMSFR